MWDPCLELFFGYGVGVVAHVAVLSSLYRHSQRMVQQALRDLFGETVPRKRQPTAAKQWSSCRAVAAQNVQQQSVVGMDETSFERQPDGHNPQQHQGWLWVMVLVSYFQPQAAQSLLGQGLRNSHQ